MSCCGGNTWSGYKPIANAIVGCSSCPKPDPCCPKPCPPACNPCAVVDDCMAREVECIFKSIFCDATIIPGIGLPSCTCGTMAISHTLGDAFRFKVNGLCTASILANNSFYSGEVSCGKFINIYMAVIPNIAGCDGSISSSEMYITQLAREGISLANDSYILKGAHPTLFRVTTSNIGMDPREFATKTVTALKCMLNTFCRCK